MASYTEIWCLKNIDSSQLRQVGRNWEGMGSKILQASLQVKEWQFVKVAKSHWFDKLQLGAVFSVL